MLLKTLIITFLIINVVICSPMYYKKNENQKYEPDLVPVSSTVIPLTVSELGAEDIHGKHSKQFNKNKKIKLETIDDPDTLITNKKKFNLKKEQTGKAV